MRGFGTWLALGLAMLAAGAVRADDGGVFDLGGDRFAAGRQVAVSAGEEGDGAVDDVFLAGESVTLGAAVSGTAHMAGRWVEVGPGAGVTEELYALGYSVRLRGDVGGDATVAGMRVEVAGDVGGDLRASGSEVTVSGAVAGSALMAGERLRLEGPVVGDAAMAGREIAFGREARVEGILTLYAEDPEAIEVPDYVAPAERVRRMEAEAFDEVARGAPGIPSTRSVVAGFAMAVIAVALTAVAALAAMPATVARWRTRALAAPWAALGWGFVVTSALLGSGAVLSMTLIGVLLVPAALVAAMLALYAGYVLGAYLLGVGIWRAAGREVPERLAGRAGLAGLGAFLSGLAWAVPLVGWIFVVALTLWGVGAILGPVLGRLPQPGAA